MTEWTESARGELERYLQQARASTGSGPEADEVVEDLRRHVHEELAAAGTRIVTEEDVRRITARLGLPESQSEIPAVPQLPAQPRVAGQGGKGIGLWFLLFFGVVLPVITLGTELVTAMCAATFFDPISTPLHTLLIALVPGVNMLAWRAVRTGNLESRNWLAWANGIALGISLFYVLLFLPMAPFAAIGVVFYGFGLLPLTPLLSFVSTWGFRVKLYSANNPTGSPLPGLWRGLAIGLLAVVALNAPVWFTRIGMQWATAEEESVQQRGLNWLRVMGHEETILRACYGRTPGAADFDPVEWMLAGNRRVSGDHARLIYYRVTGRAFNTVPAPNVRMGRGSFAALDEWTWDSDQGGEKVGGRLKGLALHSSRLDAVVENDAALAYCEWIMEFKNDAATEQESRAQILLPPGAVVSRLTLWVNGEEREAAFAGRSQVREAYQKVAIRQRRDPVLVNTCGPDRILIQCFPVPRGGGIMKLRIGMTVPVMLENGGQGLFRWPAFIERNFSIHDSLRHSVWVRANGGEVACSLLSASEGQNALQGMLREPEFAGAESLVKISRNAAVTTAWCTDARSTRQPSLIVQTLEQQHQARPESVIVVLDRSSAMDGVLDEQAATLALLVTNSASGLVVADDGEPHWLMQPGRTNGTDTGSLERQIRKIRCGGGFDNVPALLAAWDMAARHTNAAVLWIHGPQPVELSSPEPLRQRIERNGGNTEMLSLQTKVGPNPMLEKLGGLTRVRAVARWGDLGTDLQRLETSWNPDGGSWMRTLERVQELPAAPAPTKASDHLARLWMRDELIQMQRERRVAEAIPLATRYQLVTPISGAVVLETDQQYRDNNLTPSDPKTVPTIPEPTAFALVTVGLGLLAMMRRRRTY